MSDIQLKFLALRVYRAADGKAFRELYQIYYVRIRRFLAFKLPRSEDADELTGEVFLRAWEYMTAQQVENVTAFLFRVARNLIAEHYRSAKKTEPLTQMIEETVVGGNDLVEELSVKEEFAEVEQKLRHIKEEYREVLLMRFVNEMSVSEIAEALEKTPNAIRVLLFRAKQALKKVV